MNTNTKKQSGPIRLSWCHTTKSMSYSIMGGWKMLYVFGAHKQPIDHCQDIRAATASEQLTLEEEYAMQASWRNDQDKLTFISCQIEESDQGSSPTSPVGDVNLFISINEEDDGKLSLVGEIELMVAEKVNQCRGLGKAALLVFLKYVTKHQREILAEYFSERREIDQKEAFSYLRVRIQQDNFRSTGLFEGIGFRKIGMNANFFGEYELRSELTVADLVDEILEQKGITGYEEKMHQPGDLHNQLNS